MTKLERFSLKRIENYYKNFYYEELVRSVDWEDFLKINSLLAYSPKQQISIVGYEQSSANIFKPSLSFIETFPKLTQLLSKARITSLEIKQEKYFLFAWTNTQNELMAWLSPTPTSQVTPNFHPSHNLMLSYFGGILESANQPENSWLPNLNFSFCKNNCYKSFGYWGFEEDFEDLFGFPLNFNPSDYVTFAKECNGNETFYHKETGEVIMYAHDHCFDFIDVLDNYPKYTFYKIKNCKTLIDWIEIEASKWLLNLEKSDYL